MITFLNMWRVTNRTDKLFVCYFFILSCATAFLVYHLLTLPPARFVPQDDSDAPTHASGMDVRTDALTGCQYLAQRYGGITPRLNADGKQICHKDN